MTFKVGDRVKVQSNAYWNKPENDEVLIGTIIEISDNESYAVIMDPEYHRDWLKGCYVAVRGFFVKKGEGGWWEKGEGLSLITTHFPLYSEETAVKLLEERGYTVTPPPEPLKGKVVIYRNSVGEVYTTHKEWWDKWTDYVKQPLKLIAIVDWTEGQGI